MSLILKFSQVETDDRKQIIVKDKTGVYNASSNTGGFGAPNPIVGDITKATISLSKRNSDGSYTNAPVPFVNVYPTLPNTSETPFYLTAFAFGYGPTADAVFADGIYKLVYNVQNNDGSMNFSATNPFVMDKGISCCYMKKVAKIVQTRCNADLLEKKDRDIAMFWRFFQGAKCCSNLDELQNYIDILVKLCAGCGCGGGC